MESMRIEFLSEGDCVRGRFFRARGEAAATTLLLAPGMPGNPNDVMGLGAALSPEGINVMMFNPRGMHQSEGTHTFAHTLQDIGAAWRWLQQADIRARFGIDAERLVLGGASYGGGMALSYAAGDPSVRRVIAMVPNDHAEFIREFRRNPVFAETVRRDLLSMVAPQGPMRGDVEADLQELAGHQDVYGLRENAAKLADRSILLIGGWEDDNTTVEQCQLPFYRALRRAGAADVTFLVYHADHQLGAARGRLVADIRAWLQAAGTH
jgi:dipeptidyl aminopeptidase/acylaminoacyl peptidase